MRDEKAARFRFRSHARATRRKTRGNNPRGAGSEEDFLKVRPPVRIDAVENYVRGLLSTTPEQRHRYFTQAARLDAHYSQPCFELGRIYWEKKDYKVAAGWLERVARSDPHYLEAQFFLGLCRYANGDFKGAELSFQLVAEAIPLNEVFNDLGVVQAKGPQNADGHELITGRVHVNSIRGQGPARLAAGLDPLLEHGIQVGQRAFLFLGQSTEKFVVRGQLLV